MIALLGISPGDGRPLAEWVAAVGRAGLPAVLIREPSLSLAALSDAVRAAVDAVPAVAVHLRNPHAAEVAARFGVPVHAASDQAVPPRGGASAHDEAAVLAALADGARYVLLSPVWRPTSKPADGRLPLGLARFLAIAPGRPVLALGGVTPERYRALVAAGAGAAILGPLLGDPAEVTRTLSTYLRG